MEVTYAGIALNSGNRESPANLSVSVSRVVQSTALTRASHAKIYARKNSIYSISFSITYQKEDLRATQDFVARIDEWLPFQGELVFTPTDSGGLMQDITYERATLETVSAQSIGISAIVSFTFRAENRKQLPAP